MRPKPVPTPVESMIAQSDIAQDQELFTCYLGSWRDTEDIDKGESFYTFGYIDEHVLARCGATQPYYVPVDSSGGFWQFSSPSACINGSTIVRSDDTAIADTGTSLALVSDTLCRAIYAAIPGATYDWTSQGWIFPIGVPAEQLPTISFAVGTKQFVVQKEDLGFASVGGGM